MPASPALPAVAYSIAARQAVRMRRLTLACAAYAIGIVLIGAACAFGLMPVLPSALIAGTVVALNAALYLVLRSGLNLRFADPSLTKFQIAAGITLLMASTYFLESDRGIALTICLVIFTFGMFRITTREFFSLTLYALAGYALVVNLLMHFRPEAIRSVYSEWMSWIVLAAVLSGFTFLAGQISALRERLRAGNRELRMALDTINKLATRDELTGLYNRAFFAESLRRSLAQRARAGGKVALLFIDVDRFKVINDTLGHNIGDRVLCELAARISGQLRESDIVARQGGDEFVALVDITDPGQAAGEVVERLLASARAPLVIDGRELPLSISIGVAISPDDGAESDVLLRCADVAMYRAKEAGRNKYRLFSKNMVVNTVQQLSLQADLRHAVERGEMRLLYQPKVDLRSGRICGAEALLRWQHPAHGPLTPDRFIGFAEESGLIVPIGYWVLREACARAQSWDAGLHGERHVAVNLSPRQFRDAGLIEGLRGALADSGLQASRLVIEITESTAMHRPERALDLTRRIRDLGIGLSMDDFGTGYSSLGLLKRFPFTNMKLDRAFVRELPGNASDVAITRAAIVMAHTLGLTVTAEGVERQEQANFLRGEGCEEYQGYLCSPPVPEARLLELCGASDRAAVPGRGSAKSVA